MVRLLPQDEGFFDLFERAADNLQECGRLLDVFLNDFSDVAFMAAFIQFFIAYATAMLSFWILEISTDRKSVV